MNSVYILSRLDEIDDYHNNFLLGFHNVIIYFVVNVSPACGIMNVGKCVLQTEIFHLFYCL